MIFWIIYFIRSNGFQNDLKKPYTFTDPILKAVQEDQLVCFEDCSDFTIFSDVNTVAQRVSLLEHLDVFKPQ